MQCVPAAAEQEEKEHKNIEKSSWSPAGAAFAGSLCSRILFEVHFFPISTTMR